MLSSYDTTIIQVFMYIDSMLDSFVFDGYTAMSKYVATIIVPLLTIHFALKGYRLILGTSDGSAKEFMASIMKVAFVLLVGLSWGWFSKYVVQGVTDIVNDASIAVLINARAKLPGHAVQALVGVVGPESLPVAIQSIFALVAKAGTYILQQGGFPAGWIGAFFIWLTGYAAIWSAAVEILLAKILLAMLFVLAPFCVCFRLFERTEGYFDKWVAGIVGSALVFIFVSLALSFAVAVIEWAMVNIVTHKGVGVSLSAAFGIGFCGFFAWKIISKMTHQAHAIAGAVCNDSGSSLMAGAVGGVVGGAVVAAKMPGRLNQLAKPHKDRINKAGAVLGRAGMAAGSKAWGSAVNVGGQALNRVRQWGGSK